MDLIRTARSTDERSQVARLPPGRLDRAVADARNGDAAAFRLLYRESQPRLFRYLRFLAGNRADDIAERAWERAADGLRGRRGNYQEFCCWLAETARDLAHDPAIRSEPVRRVASEPTGDETDAALALIAELPPDQAEAVLLRSVMGLDARGAAKVTGRRPREVRAAARQGLTALADRL